MAGTGAHTTPRTQRQWRQVSLHVPERRLEAEHAALLRHMGAEGRSAGAWVAAAAATPRSMQSKQRLPTGGPHAELPSYPPPHRSQPYAAAAASHHARQQGSLQAGRLVDGSVKDVIESKGGDGAAGVAVQLAQDEQVRRLRVGQQVLHALAHRAAAARRGRQGAQACCCGAGCRRQGSRLRGPVAGELAGPHWAPLPVPFPPPLLEALRCCTHGGWPRGLPARKPRSLAQAGS